MAVSRLLLRKPESCEPAPTPAATPPAPYTTAPDPSALTTAISTFADMLSTEAIAVQRMLHLISPDSVTAFSRGVYQSIVFPPELAVHVAGAVNPVGGLQSTLT